MSKTSRTRSTSLTKSDLKDALGDLRRQLHGDSVKSSHALRIELREEVAKSANALRSEFREDLKAALLELRQDVRQDFSELQTSVDRYLKRTEDWHQEHIVLRARYNRLITVLSRKGLVTEKEVAL